MVPSILSGARVRHLLRCDKLTDRLMAVGFVAVVFLSACTEVLGQSPREPYATGAATAKEAGHAR